MNQNSDALLQIMSAILASSSISGGLVAWLQRKNRKQKKAELETSETQKDALGINAQSVAITGLRTELVATQLDLEKKRSHIEAQDTKIDKYDLRIEVMERIERRHLRRITALEDWCKRAMMLFALHHIEHEVPPIPKEEIIDDTD